VRKKFAFAPCVSEHAHRGTREKARIAVPGPSLPDSITRFKPRGSRRVSPFGRLRSVKINTPAETSAALSRSSAEPSNRGLLPSKNLVTSARFSNKNNIRNNT
jgi:hypothetical protein